MSARIAAVVVTYNRLSLLMSCMEHLLAQAGADCDILVIDNASTDGTGDAVRSLAAEKPRVRYQNTGANLGGAGGFNYGIRHAVEAGYDYVWIMDDDSLPEPGALAALMQADAALSGHYGFLSSVCLWTDGTPCRMNIQSVSMHGKIDLSGDRSQLAACTPVQYATFVSAFFRREVVLEMGLPIKEFFIWTDDWEYTRRLSRKYPCYVVRDSVVIHACAANLPGVIETDDPGRFNRYQCSYRNEVYLYRREGLGGMAYNLARLCLHSARVLRRAPNLRMKRLGVIWGSAVRGLSFRPPVEYIRLEGDATP